MIKIAPDVSVECKRMGKRGPIPTCQICEEKIVREELMALVWHVSMWGRNPTWSHIKCATEALAGEVLS